MPEYALSLIRVQWPSFIGAIMNCLQFLIFFLKLPLHVEIRLTLVFDALLLHVTNHTGVHGLTVQQALWKYPVNTYRLFRRLRPVDKCYDAYGARDGAREGNFGRRRHCW